MTSDNRSRVASWGRSCTSAAASPRALEEARRRWVIMLVRRQGVPEADVDDVTQNVLLAIHRAAPIAVPDGRSPEEAWRAWCFGVVRRQVASHRRELPVGTLAAFPRPREDAPALSSSSPSLEEPSGDPDAQPSPSPDPEEHLLSLLETARARQALEELRAKQADRHAVLVAYEIEERPMSEIAASLGITVNTCWNRLRLAREDLRVLWKRLLARRPLTDPERRIKPPSPARSPRSSGSAGA